MIKQVNIRNFKCFEYNEVPFAPLTLLCGLNGMGKSSLIQSLLMLRQSWLHDMLEKNEVMLNGELVHLGQGKDILYEGAENDSFSITLLEDHNTDVAIKYDSELDLLKIDEQQKLINANSVIFSNRFQYIKAERLGPRTSTTKEDYPVVIQKSIGNAGEYAAFFMILYGDEKVHSTTLQHPNSVSNTLKANVEAWMSEVSPGIQIKYFDHGSIDQTSTRFSYTNERGTTNDYRATNVGFGVSYTLPVIVALLSAKPGTLLVIENPEAHLHPRGQRNIGELIARTSAIGAQVIIETHSDHILNGIRVAVKDKILAPDNSIFHYFDRKTVNGQSCARISSPTIDKDGRFSEWPDGFFDEWDLALDKLL